ncbi:PREDICTED: F-box protein CPR30-like [Fragaria vesca subsp. vesca]
MFSLRTHIWKRIESPGSNFELDGLGILSNDALHWLSSEDELVCFRLTEEEFRTVQLPNDDSNSYFCHIGVCAGCLCVSRFPKGAWDYMELWVMKEYEVSDSWTMQFRLELSELKALMPTEVLVLESSIVSRNWTAGGYELLRIDHKEDNKRWRYILEGRQCSLIEYEESLLWISGYQSVKETEQVPILETAHKASQSRN